MQAGTFRTNSWLRFNPTSPVLRRIAQFRGKLRPHRGPPTRTFRSKSSHEKRLHTDRSAGVSSSSSSSSSSDVWLVVRSSTPPTLSTWTGNWSHFWCIPCQSGVTGKGLPRTVPFFFAPPVSLLGRKIRLPLLPSCCSCWWGLCSGFWVTVSLSYDVPTWTTFKSQ